MEHPSISSRMMASRNQQLLSNLQRPHAATTLKQVTDRLSGATVGTFLTPEWTSTHLPYSTLRSLRTI